MNVSYWYKKRTYQSNGIYRPTSKGLLVDGVKYTWKEVEKKWGLTGKVFTKRRHANPLWTMEELLTKPLQKRREGMQRQVVSKDAGAMRETRKAGNRHLPEQLEANRIACMRWR